MERQVIQEKGLIMYQPRVAICFINKGRVVNLPFTDITHISKFGNETVVYTVSITYRTHISLQELLTELPVNDFFRIHRSHIAHLKCITLTGNKNIWINDCSLPFSDYYKQQLKRRLGIILEQEYLWFSSDQPVNQR